jgi:PmbA protein
MTMESSLLSRNRCREIFEIVEKAARNRGVTDVEAIVVANAEALTRFANNTIHQNVAERSRHLSIRALIDRRTARASTNRLDDASIENTVARAVEITRSIGPDPDVLPLAAPAPIEPVERFFDATASCTPQQRAEIATGAIRLVESAGQTAAGIYSTEESVEAILNSNGVFAYHAGTMARFSITAMAADSSGWAKASSPDRAAFDPLSLARRACEKASLSASPREIEPGRYTVILEPAAVLDLVGQMFGDFGATAMADQRSFLVGRMDAPLFGANIDIDDDVRHPLQAGGAFDGEGVSRKRLKLVEGGVPRELAWCRIAANKAGVEPTGHGFPVPNEYGEAPANIVIRGGDSSVADMIRSTRRGVLVTRLWYIREVEPFEKVMTGMTRDGTFLIENGEIAGGLKNFRFNQSLVELLKNVECMSPAERASGEESFEMVVPAMKVHDFNFTEVTRF